MELPDDVLQLVRAFAKPWFKHHALYKRTLKNMSLTSFWGIRTCLRDYPEKILPVLEMSEKATAEYLVVLDEYLAETNPLSDVRTYYEKRRNLIQCERDVHRLVHMLTHPLPKDVT
jgi:hypothetical protein